MRGAPADAPAFPLMHDAESGTRAAGARAIIAHLNQYLLP
jgi:hypothetical protein